MKINLPKSTVRLPAVWGEFKIFTAPSGDVKNPHIVLINGSFLEKNKTPLVRIHSECLTGDIFGSRRCDCGGQLHRSLKLIGKKGGALIYLRQEGRGVRLINKLKAYKLQEQGLDTVEAQIKLHLPIDDRDYAIAARILKRLSLKSIRLLTNNPLKVADLSVHGIEVIERLPIATKANPFNKEYLKTKRLKLGHVNPALDD